MDIFFKPMSVGYAVQQVLNERRIYFPYLHTAERGFKVFFKTPQGFIVCVFCHFPFVKVLEPKHCKTVKIFWNDSGIIILRNKFIQFFDEPCFCFFKGGSACGYGALII